MVDSVLPLVPLVCIPIRERDMDQAGRAHDVVELVGGPLDGQRFREEGDKISHNPHHTYVLDGCEYRPWKMDGATLKMKYVGRH